MIIDKSRRLVFIHVPKTAGTTLRAALRSRGGELSEFWHQGYHQAEDRIVDLAHLPSHMWTKIVEQTATGFTTFGVVRNPFTRFRSGLKEVHRRFADEFELHTQSGLMQFVSRLDQTSIRYDWRLIHLCPQVCFTHLNGRCLLDHVLRQEFLPHDLLAVSHVIGSLHVGSPERESSGSELNEFLVDISDQLDEKVLALYRQDFEIFYPEIDLPPFDQPTGNSAILEACLVPNLRDRVLDTSRWSANQRLCWDQAPSRILR